MVVREINPQAYTPTRFLELPPLFCSFVPSCPRGPQSFLQNKPNFKMGKMTISTATLKAYANEQRPMNDERYSKQTQSKPIPNAERAYPEYPVCPACHARGCHPFDCAQARIASTDEGEDKTVYDCGGAIYNWGAIQRYCQPM